MLTFLFSTILNQQRIKNNNKNPKERPNDDNILNGLYKYTYILRVVSLGLSHVASKLTISR